jgi:hypothetical protein
MKAHIDRFSTLGGVIIVVGWSSDYVADGPLELLQDGVVLETITRAVERPDVAAQNGPEAAAWGFRAYGITADGITRSSQVGLRFPSGACIDRISSLNPGGGGADPHALWAEFVRDVNAKGGTILELGSRARSGNTTRELFDASVVQYVGVDITSGPNVDIVGDVHELSRFITSPVDFMFSISVFEHFLMPWKVALEMNKIMKVGGKAFCHSHQTWPAHDEPWDYFRFSKWAWGSLFNKHTGFRVVDARWGEPVSVARHFNWGGPFEQMEESPGWALSVCVVEKTHESEVRWDADVSDILKVEYNY